jgi:ferredoxin
MASQYVIGIWEYHVNDLSPELIKDMNEYMPTLIDTKVWQKAPQLRTIPVNRSIEAKLEILPFEKAEELIDSQKKLLVAPCICRRERSIMGEECDRPEEACLIFGKAAEYYQRNGLGRLIEKQEALDILKKADEAGLVLQPGNAQRAANICCCCGCCCAVLRTLKEYPKPAGLVSSPFYAALNRDDCEGCEKCIERCQMDALRMEDDKASLDADRCIGCGLCVTTCPTGALTLERKPDSEQPEVPRNLFEAANQLGRERGKLGPFRTAHMRLKSKFDRLMALR